MHFKFNFNFFNTFNMAKSFSLKLSIFWKVVSISGTPLIHIVVKDFRNILGEMRCVKT